MATGTQLEKSAAGNARPDSAGRQVAGLWGSARVRWAEMAAAQRGWAVAVRAAAGRTDWRAGLVCDCGPTGARSTSDLDPDDARQMAQILTQAQIPFEPTAGWRGHSRFRPRSWTRRGWRPRPRAA